MKLPISLNTLATFEAAARHLSFTRAAHELRVLQPAVSRQVIELEKSLEVKLFERSKPHRTAQPPKRPGATPRIPTPVTSNKLPASGCSRRASASSPIAGSACSSDPWRRLRAASRWRPIPP